MTTPGAASRYARFLVVTVAIVLTLCAVGVVPTRRLAGSTGVSGMLVGCAIGLVSAAVAGLLLVVIEAETPDARMRRSFLAMVARLAVVAGLGAVAVLSDLAPTSPLLLWIAISYMVLLPFEVRLAI